MHMHVSLCKYVHMYGGIIRGVRSLGTGVIGACEQSIESAGTELGFYATIACASNH